MCSYKVCKSHHAGSDTFNTFQDTASEVMKIAQFLGRDVSAAQAERIAQQCSFSNMKANPQTNYDWHKQYGLVKQGHHFMRKGQVGDWRNYYTDAELRAKIDDVTEKHFHPIGLHFDDCYNAQSAR